MWSISLHYSPFYFVLHWPLVVTCSHYIMHTRYSSASSSPVDALSVSKLLFCICCLHYPRVYYYTIIFGLKKINTFNVPVQPSLVYTFHLSSSLARFESFCARGPHQVSSGKQHKMAAESCFWSGRNLTQQLIHMLPGAFQQGNSMFALLLHVEFD